MHPNLQERCFCHSQRTVLISFTLRIAPAVFQWAACNEEEGPDYVSVYLDDVFFYSETLEDHIIHLVKQLEQAGLNLKPSKC